MYGFVNFIERCGCRYSDGQWITCSGHTEWCQVCEQPTLAGSQGLCPECLDLKDRTRPLAWKVSPA
jgi:hypothetical protein